MFNNVSINLSVLVSQALCYIYICACGHGFAKQHKKESIQDMIQNFVCLLW